MVQLNDPCPWTKLPANECGNKDADAAAHWYEQQAIIAHGQELDKVEVYTDEDIYEWGQRHIKWHVWHMVECGQIEMVGVSEEGKVLLGLPQVPVGLDQCREAVDSIILQLSAVEEDCRRMRIEPALRMAGVVTGMWQVIREKMDESNLNDWVLPLLEATARALGGQKDV